MIEDLKIFFGSLFYPKKSFEIIAKRKEEEGKIRFNWAIPYFIMAIIVSFSMLMYVPVQKQLIPQKFNKLIESGQITQEKYDKIVTMTAKILPYQDVASGFFIIINILITALFLYIYLYFFNINLTFYEILLVNVFGFLPLSIGYLISYFYNAILKFSMFHNIADMKKMVLGFHIILKDSNNFLGNFLAINNFFALWSLFIVIVGLAVLGKKSISKVAIYVLIPWLVYSVGMAMLNMRMGG